MKAVIKVLSRFEKRKSSAIAPARKSSVTMIFVEVLHFGEMDFLFWLHKYIYYNAHKKKPVLYTKLRLFLCIRDMYLD